MNNRTHLTPEKKLEIVALWKEKLSNREIARRVKCNESIVRYFLRKYIVENNLNRQRSGGAKMDREDHLLKQLALSNNMITANQLKFELERATMKTFTLAAIENRLNKMGFLTKAPTRKLVLTKSMKQSRLEWAIEKKDWAAEEWQNVIFSDEFKFNLIRPDSARRRTDQLNPELNHTNNPYVMVWGCMTSMGVGELIILDGFINTEKYKSIIKNGVIPTYENLTQMVEEPVFQDDHHARCITQYKEDLGLTSLKWPGNSHDLNPFEDLWTVIKDKLEWFKPETIADLKKKIEFIWFNEIRSSYIESLYEAMPLKIESVIKEKGDCIKL